MGAGRAWEASHGQVDGKKVFKSLAKKSNHLHEVVIVILYRASLFLARVKNDHAASVFEH